MNKVVTGKTCCFKTSQSPDLYNGVITNRVLAQGWSAQLYMAHPGVRDLPDLTSPLKAGTFMQPGSQTAIPVCSQRNSSPSSTAQGQLVQGAAFPNLHFCPFRVTQAHVTTPNTSVTQDTPVKQQEHSPPTPVTLSEPTCVPNTWALGHS